MSEKRIEQRSPIELAASYGMEEDLGPERAAKINNISSGGFCFASDTKLNVGEKIQLAVDLGAWKDVNMTVKVVWMSRNQEDGKYIVGVQIEEKKGPDFERFIKFYSNVA